MELNYDWRNFQSFFLLRKDRLPTDSTTGSIKLLIDQKTIVSAFSEGEDLSEWFGASYEEVIKAFPHREILIYDQKKVDHWMMEAIGLPHAYDQTQFLRTQAKPQFIAGSRNKKGLSISSEHFLLQAIQGWWQKFLPSTFGIYIRLDGVYGRSFLLVVKRGRLDSFQVPDLSGMIPERRKYPADVSRHLSENNLVPVQGLFLTTEEWLEWSSSPHPWPNILKSLRSGKNKLNPFSWGVLFLIACKAHFGF